LKAELARRLGVPVAVNIEEVRKPEIDAQLIADSITQQLEKRIMFRRAMKRAMQNAMRLGAQGIKIMSSGRLNGIEIARTEWYREGRVPLHTLRADIDYGFSEAKTDLRRHRRQGVGLPRWTVWVLAIAPVAKPESQEEERARVARPARVPDRRGGRPGGAPATAAPASGCRQAARLALPRGRSRGQARAQRSLAPTRGEGKGE
jgi:small subunit ribosomal protein S3